MKSFATLSFAALAAAATLVSRDAAAVSADVDAITSGLSSLNDAVTAFNGGSAQEALDVQNQVGPLVDTINQGASDASSSDPFTEGESGDIGTKVLALQDPIKEALDNLVGKADTFEAALTGASGIILDDLNQLQQATDSFGSALTEKLTPSFAALAPGIISSIDALFESAKSAFSGGGSTPDSTSSAPTESSTEAPSSTAEPTGSASAEPTGSASESSSVAVPTYGSSSAAVPTYGSAAPTGTSAPTAPVYGGNGTSPTGPTTTPEPYHGAASMVSFSVGSALLAVVAFAL